MRFKWFANVVVITTLTIFIPPCEHPWTIFKSQPQNRMGRHQGDVHCAWLPFPSLGPGWFFSNALDQLCWPLKSLEKIPWKTKRRTRNINTIYLCGWYRNIGFKSFHKTVTDVLWFAQITSSSVAGNALRQHFTSLVFYPWLPVETMDWPHWKTFYLEAGGHLPVLNPENELMEPIHVFKAGFICDWIDYKKAISCPHVLLSHCTEFFLTSSVQD